MGREGWIYGLVFVAILGAGALMLGPRLVRLAAPGVPAPGAAPGDAGAVPPRARSPEGPSAPAGPSPGGATAEPEPPAAAAPMPWIEVRLRGPAGPLRGPVKPVGGAEVDRSPDTLDPDVLVVRATADVVRFGASGHQWVSVARAALHPGLEVVLPEAAPPIVLRVREVDGRPAPGVPVLVLPAAPGPLPRTDAGGTVVLDDLAPGLVVVDVGGRERRGPTLRLLAGSDLDTKAVLEPAWRITGRAVDAGGRALAGTHVDAVAEDGPVGGPTMTDEEGRFTWTGPVRDAVSLRLRGDACAPREVEVRAPSLGALATDLADVVLARPGGSIEGRVTGVTAVSAAKAEVRVEPAVAALLGELFGPDAALVEPRRVPVGPDGRFEVDDLRAGIPLRVSLRGLGLPLDQRVTLTDGEKMSLELVPATGLSLSGRVLDGGGGAPVFDLALLVSTDPAEGDARPSDREVRTDRAGRFSVGGLSSGPVYLRAAVPGRGALAVEASVPAAAPLEIQLPPAGSGPALEGVVVDDGNTPLLDVTVRAAGLRTRTGADGRFRLAGVRSFGDAVDVTAAYAPGPVASGVDPRPFADGVRRRARPADGPVRLVLPRTRSVSFTALDGLDDAPLAFVHVVARTDGGDVVADRAIALSSGAGRVDGLPPMTGYTFALFTAQHRKVVVVPLRSDLAPAAESGLGVVRLGRGMRVHGTVVDADGKPIAHARVGALEPGWLRTRSSDPALGRELLDRWVDADASGRFLLQGLDPRQPAPLAAWAPGYAPVAWRARLEEFRDDPDVSIQIRLRRGGYLDVDLVESDGTTPVPGAILDLEDARTGSDYLDALRRGMLGGPVASDEDWQLASEHYLFEHEKNGTYRLGPIAPGPYDVWVERPGYRPLERRLTILDPSESDALIDVVAGRERPLEMLTLTWTLEAAR